MNKQIKLFNLSLIGLLIIFSTLEAKATNNNYNYFGVDLIYSSMKFKKFYGDNLFPKSSRKLNFYGGFMFNQFIGLEAGFEIEKTQKKEVIVPEGNFVAGVLIGGGVISESYRNKFKQNFAYLGLLTKIDLTKSDFISITWGLTRSHIKAIYHFYNNGLNVAPNITRTFEKNKIVPIIRASINHEFNNNLGIRLMAAWKNTNKFKNIKSIEAPNNVSEIKLKNNIQLGTGIFYII